MGKQVPVCWLGQPSGTRGAGARSGLTSLPSAGCSLRAPLTGERRAQAQGFWKPLGPEPREGRGGGGRGDGEEEEELAQRPLVLSWKLAAL